MFSIKHDEPIKSKHSFDSQKELRKIPPELMTINQYDDIQEKLLFISNEIESIGKICDSRQNSSRIHYQSNLDKQRNEIDEETQKRIKELNKLVEKQKNEHIPRYKKEYQIIKRQVKHLITQLKKSEQIYCKNNNKLLLLIENDSFYANQLETAQELNDFLNYRFKNMMNNRLYPTLTSSVSNGDYEKSLTSNRQYSSSINRLDSSKNNKKCSSLLLTSINLVKKITKRFDLNEKIISNKLVLNRKKLSSNINKYQSLTVAKENKYMVLLKQIVDDINNIYNSKINNMNNQSYAVLKKVKSVTSVLSPSINYNNATILDDRLSALTSREKKAIIIKFLEAEQVKQLIYDLLYKDITRFPYIPYKSIE